MGDESGYRGAPRAATAFDRCAVLAANIADVAILPLQRFAERRPAAALAAALSTIFVGALSLPAPGGGSGGIVFAGFQHVVDELGVRLVEGHADAIHAAAAESRVSATLLAAIVYAESRGRGGQTSSAGALGLGQLSLAAATDAAKRLGLPAPALEEVRDDDALNLRLAAAHLRWLLDNSPGWSLEQVLVSYNAGRARLFQWLERAGSFDAWVLDEERRAATGERTTGSLAYARQITSIRERLRQRGRIADAPR